MRYLFRCTSLIFIFLITSQGATQEKPCSREVPCQPGTVCSTTKGTCVPANLGEGAVCDDPPVEADCAEGLYCVCGENSGDFCAGVCVGYQPAKKAAPQKPAAGPKTGDEITFFRMDNGAESLRYTERGAVFQGAEFSRNGEKSFRHVEDFSTEDGCPNGEPGRHLRELYLTADGLIVRSASLWDCGDSPEKVWSEWTSRYTLAETPEDCRCTRQSYCYQRDNQKVSLGGCRG